MCVDHMRRYKSGKCEQLFRKSARRQSDYLTNGIRTWTVNEVQSLLHIVRFVTRIEIGPR